jgi:predicted phage gp36 major capsid-like protein
MASATLALVLRTLSDSYDAISEACQLSQRVAIPSEKDDALLNVLTRYEGAVGDVERDGDTSDEAIKELAQARAELMRLLRAAKEIEEKS